LNHSNPLNPQKNLILLGGGGHCKSVIDVAEAAGYNILGILDRPDEVGKEVLGYKVIGTDDDIANYVDKAEFIITVGFVTNPKIRIKLDNKIKDAGGKLATIISPTAYVSPQATIGDGTVIMHRAVICVNVKIGRNCIINTLTDVDHEASIGDFTHLSAGVLIGGGARVGERCFCGMGTTVVHMITLGNDIIMGAGSLAIKDVNDPGVYCGHPAKYLRKNE